MSPSFKHLEKSGSDSVKAKTDRSFGVGSVSWKSAMKKLSFGLGRTLTRFLQETLNSGDMYFGVTQKGFPPVILGQTQLLIQA